MIQSGRSGAVLIIVAIGVGFALARTRETPQVATGQFGARHHVVYFVGAPSSGSLSPLAIQAQLAMMPEFLYTEAAQWSEVLEAQESYDVNVLIVDSGSLESSDASWVADKYRTGTAILGIGVSLDDIGSLVSSEMIAGTVAAHLKHQEHYSGAYTTGLGPPSDAGGAFHTLHVGTEVDGVGPFYSLMLRSTADDDP